MAKAAFTALWAGVVASALSGCGTVHNFYGDHSDAPPCEVFGGVRSDVKAGVQYIRFDPARDHGDYPVQVCADPAVQFYARAIGWYLLTVDLPLSVVGDTLTLPCALVGQLAGKSASAQTKEDRPQHGVAQTGGPASASVVEDPKR
jgi:uncharacterized protein YceK